MSDGGSIAYSNSIENRNQRHLSDVCDKTRYLAISKVLEDEFQKYI